MNENSASGSEGDSDEWAGNAGSGMQASGWSVAIGPLFSFELGETPPGKPDAELFVFLNSQWRVHFMATGITVAKAIATKYGSTPSNVQAPAGSLGCLGIGTMAPKNYLKIDQVVDRVNSSCFL